MSQATNSTREDHGDRLKAANEHAAGQALIQHYVHARIAIHYGNIFDVEADAIVNAANSRLLGGGGIDGQIHSRAGGELRNWIRANILADQYGDRLEPGGAVVTPGFALGKRVIHTVGPIVDGEPSKADADTLASCYEAVIEAASNAKIEHVAVPCISTGVYGYPMLNAAQVELSALERALDRNPGVRVTAVVFNDVEQDIWRKITA